MAVACGGGAASHIDGQLSDVARSPDAPVDAAGLLVTTGMADPSFGSGGFIAYDTGGIDRSAGAVLLPSGRLLVAVQSQPVGSDTATTSLVAFTSDGALDLSFGSGGIVPVDETGGILGMLADGSTILVIGDVTFEHRLADGSLDAAYGGSGHASAGFEIAGRPVAIQGPFGVFPAVLDPSGRIYISAYQSDNHTLISRLTATGQRDFTFGGGTVQAGFGNPTHMIAEPDGSLWVAVAQDAHAIEVRHILNDGTLDPAYGGAIDGVAGYVHAAVLDGSGRVTIAGVYLSGSDGFLARFGTNGALDTSYHGGLLDVGPAAGFPTAISRAAGGEILALGSGMPIRASVLAVDASGDHATSYPSNAYLWLNLFELTGGKILAVGFTGFTQTAADDVVIGRFLP